MASIVYNTLRLTLFFIVMITGLLLTNIALLLNLMILPFSRRLFHYLGPRIPQTWCCFCLFYLKKYLHFNFKYDTPSLNSIERAVVVTNHQSMFDIAVLYYFGFISGKGHNLRWLGKKSFKYTPLLGWGGWWSGTLMFLHRNWARDREQLTADLKSLTTSVRPFWFTFFPEGTRLTPVKLQHSQQYAQHKNYPVFRKVLLPRSKGFIAAVHILREHIDAMLDISIHYSQRPPFIAAIIRGDKVNVTVNCKIIPTDTLPHADADLKQHLFDIFQTKDTYLQQME